MEVNLLRQPLAEALGLRFADVLRRRRSELEIAQAIEATGGFGWLLAEQPPPSWRPQRIFQKSWINRPSLKLGMSNNRIIVPDMNRSKSRTELMPT